MLHSNLPSTASLGADIRALRKARGLTLSALAEQLGRSVGWLSQVERDKSVPNFDDLRAFAEAFGVPLSMFFGQTDASEDERGIVVRRETRRRIGTSGQGLVEELLSPDLTDDFEVVHSIFEPGAATPAPVQRPTQEVAYLISGQLDLTVDGQAFTIRPGDSFRIRGQAFTYANPYAEPAVAIWVIAPPVY